MKELKQRFGFKDGNVHVGRGIAFHIAPSNVPVNYAYSLVSGLLCGNANIVRVPTKEFAQVTIINTAIKKVLEAHPEIKPYICLVRYERDYDINNLLSDMCDVRIVWGGDATVGELRKSKLPVRASEVTFADRYSLAVIDSDAYMLIEDKDKTATDFYNDTYLTDQNACTSPKVVVWTGAQKEKAKEIFWDRLYAEVKKKYIFQPIMGVDKLSQSFLAATAEKDFGKVKLLVHESNLLVRVRVTRLSSELMEYKGNSGYFYEYDMEDVLELADFCNDTHCQTIGIIGDKKMVMPLLKLGLKGVDRVVKVGHTMEFDLNWDGYNLAERLTRTVVI
nr:acyl-CoA reductase [Mediterraneibacter hominis]